jgi:hypothetical protein
VARDFFEWGKKELAKRVDPNQFVTLQKLLEASQVVDLNSSTKGSECTEAPKDALAAAA